MRERDQFAVARTALAGYAAAGRFGWGHPLVATSLATELGLSPTPVREALAHLDRHPVTVSMTKEESAGFNHL